MLKKFRGQIALVAQRSAVLAMVAVLAACASKKPAPATQATTTPPPVAAPATQSLEQYLQDAAKAAAEGNDKERARETYRTAARMYPSSKEPWLKLAEDYFEVANYGQAILAAQEVVQRDPDDGVGTSILAVSGLRVSVAALATMQSQKGKLSGGTRSEAQTLARMLRESIGESELVPQPATTSTPAPAPAPAAKPAAKPRPPVRRPAATAAAPAAAPAAADDPFTILKK
jgi:tetratricopeptide (TPR) repeat protein